MIGDFELAAGDICGDATGLRVKVEDVDIYNYVHFSVVENREDGGDEAGMGEMSRMAFAHRFTKLGNTFHNRTAA
jgi:hypothetical protein